MTSDATSEPILPGRTVGGYFKALSSRYAQQTGDSTFHVIHSFVSKLPSTTFSGPSAIVHDNACGVGTATTAILLLTPEDRTGQARIEATDSSESMIQQLKTRISQNGWTNVRAEVADSHALPFPDNTFTMSVTNISVTNFVDPMKCLQEIYRTVRPGGLAVVSIWKRFTVAELIHQAQRSVKGLDVKLMGVPRDEFFGDGYLRERVIEAGFERGKVEQSLERIVVKGKGVEGMKGFMIGPLTASANEQWTEEEKGRWNEEIEKVVAKEVEKNDGIAMEAWCVSAKK